jgi:hypothetical protein
VTVKRAAAFGLAVGFAAPWVTIGASIARSQYLRRVLVMKSRRLRHGRG